MSSGTDVCFLCNYPGVENEHWSTSCGVDQDGMCMCTITDTSPGIQLCFSSFNSDCSGIYSCNVTMEQTGLVCSAEAEIVATGINMYNNSYCAYVIMYKPDIMSIKT